VRRGGRRGKRHTQRLVVASGDVLLSHLVHLISFVSVVESNCTNPLTVPYSYAKNRTTYTRRLIHTQHFVRPLIKWSAAT